MERLRVHGRRNIAYTRKMKNKVTIKAEGDNASGKSYLLKKIKMFLEKEFKVNDNSLNDKHELVVVNKH